MPKIKTHSGAKKRFDVTAGGKIKRKRAGLRHQHKLLKTTKNKRRLRQGAYADKTNVENVRELIPYK